MGRLRSIAACVVVTCTACTSFAETAECSAPPLVAVAGDAANPVENPSRIELWNPDGGIEVLSDDPAAFAPALSPDGDTVAVALGAGEWSPAAGWPASRVALLSVATGEVTVVSQEIPGGQIRYLEWSTSGDEVAFLRVAPEVREIVALDVATGAERRLIPAPAGASSFSWSPDGREMLVPTVVDAATSPAVDLRRYFLGSGHHLVLETYPDGIGRVAWSPGGHWVAMEANLPGTTRERLFALDLDSGRLTAIDRRSGEPQGMAWSGPFLLYTYRVGPDGAPALMSWDSRTQRRSPVERAGAEQFVASPISAPRCESAAV